MNPETKTCLNCGAEVTGKFCAECGQPVSTPARITATTFGKAVSQSFGRMSTGFFITCWHLMYKPWDVIRDYLHGRRMRYTQPFTLFLQVFFLSAVLESFLEKIFGNRITGEDDIKPTSNWFVNMLIESDFVIGILISFPFIMAVYLAYWKFGSRRFNVYEYIVTFFYMMIAMRLYDFLLFPLLLIDENLQYAVLYVIFGILGVGTALKAFPIKPWWKKMLILLWGAFIFIVIVNILYRLHYFFFWF